MIKYVLVFFVLIFTDISISYSQDDRKSAWQTTVSQLDSMFAREQRQFRLMQSYQNDATEELILKDIDSLRVFMVDVNSHIDMCNKFALPNTTDGKNASETLNLKIGVLKEYFEQCMLQIQVNNNILQKNLKNESLDFKVSQIRELMLKDFTPMYKQ